MAVKEKETTQGQTKEAPQAESKESPQGRILVADDEEVILRVWRKALQRKGYQVFLFNNGQDALEFLQEQEVDVVLADNMMPGLTGMEVIKHLKADSPETEIILMTGYASIETALEAMKLGAYDYLQKPFENIEAAVMVVERACERKQLRDRNRQLEQRLEVQGQYQGIIGASPKMLEVFELVESVARFDASILITGETGTGKEQVARALHYKSDRQNNSFVAVVCSAIPEGLIESALFGHRKGSFTGANQDRAGFFEAAQGGTLFLDEVGDIPLNVQVKLLRALQEGEIQRVGDAQPTPSDVRIIAATNCDLRQEIREGRFREDLYYRLNVIGIHLPPLQDRVEDIPLLAHHFLKMHSQRFGKEIYKIHPDVLTVFQSHPWPGNVRQLENVLERAVILEQSDSITTRVLPAELLEQTHAPGEIPESSYVHLPYKRAKQLALQNFEQRYLQGILARTDHNISAAARLAGMDRANFRRVLKKYDFSKKED